MSIKNNKILNSRMFLLLLLVILSGVAFSLFKEVYRKYQINQEINKLKAEIESLTKNNQGLNDLIQYFEDGDYIEKEARRKLNLAKPGENMIIITGEKDETAEKEDLRTDYADDIEKKESHYESTEAPNPLKWWRYLFRVN